MTRRILVVEDSPTQAERARLLLAGAGYDVDVAANGREGLARVRHARPDLVISDVVMPHMDGYTLCRAVKRHPATRRLPFVLLTDRRTPLDILRGLEHGADNFITKPFDDDYLLERVRRIFEHVEFRERGQLEIDVTLRAGGRELIVSADKQQIIELLFANFEELCRLNAELEVSRRAVENHARDLESIIERRTRQLREAEEEYRGIFENAPIGIFRTSRDGRILVANPAAARILGYDSPADLVASVRNVATDVYGHSESRVEVVRALDAHGHIAGLEFQAFRKDRSRTWVAVSALIKRDDRGEVVGYEGMIQDIGDRKQAEAAVEAQRQALYQREKLAAMGTLLAGVAHELNNPLAVVLGQAALLREVLTEGPGAARTVKIVQAADRCARIVRNFLALARQQAPARTSVDVNTVVREALELLSYPLKTDGVELRLELAEGLPLTWADGHQLHQVIVNLVTNAQQAMRGMSGPRRITIATRHDPAAGTLTLDVTDSGPGIPPEVRSRLFEPFFTTKPAGQGTGLGLSLCLSIVESHGGTIDVTSTVGAGASFVVALPVSAPEGAPAVAELPTPGVGAPGRRILVVDDESELAEVLGDILAAEGHTVDRAANGDAALELIGRHDYALILSDIKMPGLDGPALYRTLQVKRPVLARRVIFLTGDALSADTAAFLGEAGVQSIGKPFAVEDVRRVVRQALVAS